MWYFVGLACGFLAAGIVMIGMGLQPDQPPTPFMGTPYMGTDIYIALICGACACICIAAVQEQRAFNRAKGKT
jgi:hypothetical protein